MKTGDKATFTLNIPDIDAASPIDFIYIEGIGYVADRNVCVNISYNDLEDAGLVLGKELTIGGKRYLCRILTTTE